jgi:hypothetical protein
VKNAFESTFADDLVAVDREWGARVLVAHTTGVGGMYDETTGADGKSRLRCASASRTPRATSSSATSITRPST